MKYTESHTYVIDPTAKDVREDASQRYLEILDDGTYDIAHVWTWHDVYFGDGTYNIGHASGGRDNDAFYFDGGAYEISFAYGWGGDDILYFGDGTYNIGYLNGGAGDDKFYFKGGTYEIHSGHGGSGDDTFYIGKGTYNIDGFYGGKGSDTFHLDAKTNVGVLGGGWIGRDNGHDTVYLAGGNYTLSGTARSLRITGTDDAGESYTYKLHGIEEIAGYDDHTYTFHGEVEGLNITAGTEKVTDNQSAVLISESEMVFENPKKGDVIYTVEAYDPDEAPGSDDFEYTLIGDPSDFAIDKDGGAITYNGDHINSHVTHTLTVQSTEVDSGATATHTIEITLLSTEMVLDFSGEERGNILGRENERVEFNGDGNDIKQIHGDHGWDAEMQHIQNDTIIINGENNEIDGVYGNQGNDILVFNGTGNKINSIGGGGGNDKIYINTHIFKHGDNKYVYMYGGEGHDQLHFKKASHWALGSNDNNWVTDNRGDYKKEGDFSNADEVFYFRHEDVEYILTGFEEITVGGSAIYEVA